MILSNLTSTSESWDEVKKAMETPEQEAFRANINKNRKNAQITALVVGLIMFAIPLILSGVIAKEWAVGAVLGAFLGIISAIFVLVISSSSNKKKISASIVPYVVKSVLGKDAVYEGSAGFSRKFLSSLKAFPVNILNQTDRIHGSYLGVPFMCSDVTSFHYETRTTGKNTYTTTVVDFTGSIFVYRFNKPSDAIIRIIQKGFIGNLYFSGKAEKLETESIQFNNTYTMLVNDKEQALFVMTPQNILATVDCSNYVKGRLLFLIDKENLIIVASGPTRPLSDAVSGKFDDADLMKMANMLTPVKAFIKTLDLTNTYWRDIERLKNYTPDYLVREFGGPGKSGSRSGYTKGHGSMLFDEMFRDD